MTHQRVIFLQLLLKTTLKTILFKSRCIQNPYGFELLITVVYQVTVLNIKTSVLDGYFLYYEINQSAAQKSFLSGFIDGELFCNFNIQNIFLFIYLPPQNFIDYLLQFKSVVCIRNHGIISTVIHL